uniref:Magnesium chelatase, subunit ChlI n=1 Tax=Candidatus Kentrum sp. FW TaxID=2126338 RepID=A0A450TX02_9GAMM|nr:MAG: Magnesium chelatase, subunit ChlI [Candidatus Kentron sp. FW]
MNYKPTHFRLPADDIWHPPDPGYPPYLFSEEIAVAVDVALTVNRPLLVAGPPGSGKSTLAVAMAGLLRTRLLKHTLTSRSSLEELTADFDHLRRLRDATAGKDLPEDWAYLKPGLLWWAFDPESAARRGASQEEVDVLSRNFKLVEAIEPCAADFRTNDIPSGCSAVVLLDEIDKAEPDLPNDLLEPLDLLRFQVFGRPDIQAREGTHLLVIITTNGERELPPAFLRRCTSLFVKHPDPERLVAIGQHHFRNILVSKKLLETVANRLEDLRSRARELGLRAPGTSEYLDAVRACHELKIGPEDDLWNHIEAATLIKQLNQEEGEG